MLDQENHQGPWSPWLAWYQLERAAEPHHVLMRHSGDTWIVQIEKYNGVVWLADSAPTPSEAITKVLQHVHRNLLKPAPVAAQTESQ